MLNNYYLHDQYIFSIIFPSPCCLEKTFFCLWRRGTRSMTGLKKVTWGKHTYVKKAHTHFAFKHGTQTNEPFKCNISKKHFQHRCVCHCVCMCMCLSRCTDTHLNIFVCIYSTCKDRFYECIICVQLLYVAATHLFDFVCVCLCICNLSQQQSLRLQLQLNSVFLIIQELFKLHILQSTQRAVVLPVNSDLHLP